MAVHRLSISVPPELVAQIRDAAAEAGVSVSTWLARAAEQAAKNDGRRGDSCGRPASSLPGI